MRNRLIVPAVLLAAALVVRADAPTPGQRAAAMDLLLAMKTDTLMNDVVRQMLDAQMAQNPALVQFRPQMEAFFAKYLSWESLKDDLANLYAEEFTEAELKEVTAFYRTPVGQKMVQKLPVLTQRGMQLGQARVQQHAPELEQAIKQATQK